MFEVERSQNGFRRHMKVLVTYSVIELQNLGSSSLLMYNQPLQSGENTQKLSVKEQFLSRSCIVGSV